MCFAAIVQSGSCIENASTQGDGATMIIILPRGDVTGRPFFFHGARVPRARSEWRDIKYDENDLRA